MRTHIARALFRLDYLIWPEGIMSQFMPRWRVNAACWCWRTANKLNPDGDI